MSFRAAAQAAERRNAPNWLVRPWPADRRMAPPVLTDLDGQPWRLAGLKGQVVLLNFWASWCEPCRAEMPALERLAQRHEREGLRIVAINFRESVETIRRFLDSAPLNLPIVRDADGDMSMTWTPRVFPSTVVVGRDGNPVCTVIGEADWLGDDARQLLAPLLAAPRPS